MSLKSTIRKFLPTEVLEKYHFIMSWLAALLFRLPTKHLKVIGVTGTKGKTTTSNIIWHILNSTGHRAGLVSTAQFSTGTDNWLNDLKMTMPGRFKLQKLFRQMVKNGCEYVVLETSSEGLAQWRHAGIVYQAAVFTNLTPEHIESHGSFENYKAAKAKLWQALSKSDPSISVVNLDDIESDYFNSLSGNKKIGYTLQNNKLDKLDNIYSAKIKSVDDKSSQFIVSGETINLKLGGEFNVANALAALSVVCELGVTVSDIKKALESYQGTPGRMEFVDTGKDFEVVVDYAHTPESLEQVYMSIKPQGRLIAILGSCGGGRDKIKRPALGKLAGQYADIVFVTNEDPYDEDPMNIIKSVAHGAIEVGKDEGKNLFMVFDRREAIHQALAIAKPSDVIVITGKGSEQWLCVAGDRKIPWDDRKIVQEELVKLV